VAQIFNITFVTGDPRRLGRFWQAVTGYPAVHEADDLVRLRAPSPAAPDVLLIRSDSPPEPCGRVHLDLAAADLDLEVRRLTAAGATLADGGSPDAPALRTGNGIAWIVLLDPDGNELCLGGLP
jgi:catechol 2,3-dioxygenase-like lactoylglutathione lyase family enzyme